MPHKLYSLFMFTRGEKRELSGQPPLASFQIDPALNGL